MIHIEELCLKSHRVKLGIEEFKGKITDTESQKN